jgi:DNA invertase Pin-like site-specific DNA recombinase
MTKKNLKNTYCYYVRVSTHQQGEKGTYENQIYKIKEYAETHGLPLSREYRDIKSGASKLRADYNTMMSEIHLYKGVIVNYIDRLGRNMIEQLRTLVDFHDKKIEIHSVDYGEVDIFNLDDQLKYVFESYFGAKERERIISRITAGIERYRREHDGKWGRGIKTFDINLYNKLNELGLTKVAIAGAMSISRSTLYRKLAQLEEKKGEVVQNEK